MAIQFTANFNIPYPAADRSDTADVPRDIKALADRLDLVALGLRRDDLIGEIKIWPASGPPPGFVICDGSLLDRAGTYHVLYLKVGLVYSEGGIAADKFRIPDLRGRVPVGVDGAAGRINLNEALGESGGDAAVQGSGYGAFAPGSGASGLVYLSQTDNNMQPYQIVNYIIRYA